VNIHHELELARDPVAVWTLLWEVERVAGCIRGCRDVEVVEAQQAYRATIVQSVGPFRVTFPLAIDVRAVDPPRSLTVGASGRDSKLGSRMQGILTAALSSPEPGRTRVAIDLEVNLQGKLATLGHGIIERKARDELAAFGACLGELLGGTPSDGGGAGG
jgi:carbon monoxide dehydrogenase subunit G